jgi:hypothetical protein
MHDLLAQRARAYAHKSIAAAVVVHVLSSSSACAKMSQITFAERVTPLEFVHSFEADTKHHRQTCPAKDATNLHT